MDGVVNSALREHVTSIGFSMTLSKRQIDLLVALHHFKGNFHQLINWEHAPVANMGGDRAEYARRRKFFSHSVPSGQALEHRGLISHDIERWDITKAGHLVVALLKEAGIYQERLSEIGLAEQKSEAA